MTYLLSSNDVGATAGVIGWALEQVFDSDLKNTVLNQVINPLLGAIQDMLVNNGSFGITQIILALQGISCALIILYFGIQIANAASKEILTTEKLVMLFIQFFVAAALIVLLQYLLKYAINLGIYLCDWAGSFELSYDGGADKFKFWGCDTPTEAMESGAICDQNNDGFKKGITQLFTKFNVFSLSLVVGLFCFITKIAIAFIAASLAVMIIVRCVFSPIAIVQCFEGDLMRSSGIMYFKRLIGDMIGFSVIVVILMACSKLGAAMLASIDFTDATMLIGGKTVAEYAGAEYDNGTLNITRDTIQVVFGWRNLVKIILPQLAAIGGVAGAGRLGREIVGTN